jgi:hypothetical protein
MKITADNTSDGSEGRNYARDFWNSDDLTFTTGSGWDAVKPGVGRYHGGSNDGIPSTFAGPVFSDDFETNSTARWDSETDTGSNFNVNTGSKYWGSYGAEVTVGATAGYVTDTATSRAAPMSLRARFYLDPNSITMATNDEFTVLAQGTSATPNYAVNLNYDGANYRVRACLLNDAGSLECSGYVNINDAFNAIEAEWRIVNTTGSVRIWVNGAFGSADYTVDAGTRAAADFLLGNVSGRDAGTSGSIYVDDFKWTYVGKKMGSTSFDVQDGAYGAVAANNEVNLDLDGGTYTRYKPAFKIKSWRNGVSDSYGGTTLEGAALADGTDYNASLKPVTSSYFGDEVVFETSLDSATAITSPIVGSGPAAVDSVSANFAYVLGRYGNAVAMSGSSTDVDFPTSGNFDINNGAAEFWLRTGFTESDNVYSSIFGFYNSGVGDYFEIVKEDASGTSCSSNSNCLVFTVWNNNSVQASVYFTTSEYSATYGEWHHVRIAWDGTLSTTDDLQLYWDGQKAANRVGAAGAFDPSVISVPSAIYIGNEGETSTGAVGTYDEFRMYDDAAGSSDEAIDTLAAGGDATDANEYLNDATNDYTVDLVDDDANNRAEYLFIGSDERFNGLNVDLATLGVGSSLDLGWEYWNGTAWTDLESVAGFTDGTSNFTADGAVYWSVEPTNWAPYSVNYSPDLYFVRVHLEGGTYSTNPIEDQILTDIVVFQYLGNVSSNAQTLDIVVPEYLLILAVALPVGVGLVRRKRI